MDIAANLRRGFLTGLVVIFVLLLGVQGLVGRLLMDWFKLPSQTAGAWVLLLGVALLTGSTAARQASRQSWGTALVRSLLSGAPFALVVALFVGVVSYLIAAQVDVRTYLVQLTPQAIGLLTWGLSSIPAAMVDLGLLLAGAAAGALLAWAAARYGWRAWRQQQWARARSGVLNVPAVQSARQYRYTRYIVYGVGLVLLLLAPLVLGQYWNYNLGTVGIYVMLGVGLNIVVGLAGLLDLGYVAFFAIGAYTVALLTAPTPHGIQASFWLALPLGTFLAAIAGVLLGIPVLRMRGDYLAIVTLGFGEIIRILSKSDVLTSFSGGPRGIRAVGGPSLFGIDLDNEFFFLYLILLGIVLVVFLTVRLQNSRVGRAWMAMRDDEDVAKATGIHTLRYKLLAFAVGAAFAGLSGVLFASRNRFTGPEDFTLLVSINVLCLVIVGGMGSIPGVILGALALKGLPEALRQLQDYRMLVFGTLLVVMMILRPEGLWPSTRRRMELREPDK